MKVEIDPFTATAGEIRMGIVLLLVCLRGKEADEAKESARSPAIDKVVEDAIRAVGMRAHDTEADHAV